MRPGVLDTTLLDKMNGELLYDLYRMSDRTWQGTYMAGPGKCTIVRISRPEGTEIMSGQNFLPNKTGTLAWTHAGRRRLAACSPSARIGPQRLPYKHRTLSPCRVKNT